MPVHPFWGAERPDLYDVLQRTTDPDERIAAAIADTCPWSDRMVLDVGCGRGDFAARMTREAGAVAAVDVDSTLADAARCTLRARAEGPSAVLRADAEDLPFAAASLDAVYALWAYFFGPGAEPGLLECIRVLRPGGVLCVVQNNGGDELSHLWAESELCCLEWPDWFRRQGFSRRVVETTWRFPSLDEATALVRFLWGEDAVGRLLEAGSLEFSFKVSLYCRRIEREDAPAVRAEAAGDAASQCERRSRICP